MQRIGIEPYEGHQSHRQNARRHRDADDIAAMSFTFNDPATNEIYTLSLHDALPISQLCPTAHVAMWVTVSHHSLVWLPEPIDRKSTRLNSSPPISRMPASAR